MTIGGARYVLIKISVPNEAGASASFQSINPHFRALKCVTKDPGSVIFLLHNSTAHLRTRACQPTVTTLPLVHRGERSSNEFRGKCVVSMSIPQPFSNFYNEITAKSVAIQIPREAVLASIPYTDRKVLSQQRLNLPRLPDYALIRVTTGSAHSYSK